MPKPIRPIRVEGNLAYITLTQGYEATINAEDVLMVEAWNWCAQVTKRTDGTVRAVYAKRMDAGGQRLLYLHRVITDAPDGLEVDHRDNDGLNNRRDNLRLATGAQNQHNGRSRLDNTSGFKGVAWHKASDKWRVQIKLNGKNQHLGLFDDINDAAAAYAKASAELHGTFGHATESGTQ